MLRLGPITLAEHADKQFPPLDLISVMPLFKANPTVSVLPLYHGSTWIRKSHGASVATASVIALLLLFTLTVKQSTWTPPTMEDAHKAELIPDVGSRGGASSYDQLTPNADDKDVIYGPLEHLDHLILVPGHAIFTGSSPEQIGSDDYWILEDFQKSGQVTTFVAHIERSLHLLSSDPNSLLVFSGGQTRRAAGPQAEGQSYWEVANLLVQEQQNAPVSAYHIDLGTLLERATSEDFARDSYENLLFSLCRFHEVAGHYPSRVTVVGFEFKRERFVSLHRAAIRYPLARFSYIGIDPEISMVNPAEGERINSLEPFKQDLYACHDSLQRKKRLRNPFRRRHPYAITCPSLANILNYCPANRLDLFSEKVPW